MLTSIAELGKVWIGKDIEALIDHSPNTKQLLVIKIELTNDEAKYQGISIEEKGDEIKYLYRRDMAGKPGQFLTGKINAMEIKNLKDSLKKQKNQGRELAENEIKKTEDKIKKFIQNKIGWLPVCKALRIEKRSTILGEWWNSRLSSIAKEINNNIDKIGKDAIGKLEPINLQELLITVQLIEDSQNHYIGEIPEFVELFKETVMLKEKRKNDEKVPLLACLVCNKDSAPVKFKENPVPFFTLDKPSFCPNGDSSENYKVLPICDDCNKNLRRGLTLINDQLDFPIPNTRSDKPIIKFWLIPTLNDLDAQKEFIKDLHGTLYLKNLDKMCKTLDLITMRDIGGLDKPYESFLSFAAIFYSFDQQKHMRLNSSIQGIYPNRLKDIVNAKTVVDSMYPFYHRHLRFGFPLLCDFMKFDKTRPLSTAIASITANIFLEHPVDSTYIVDILYRKIFEESKKGLALDTLVPICLNALITLEYLLFVKIIGGWEKQMEISSSLPVADPMAGEAKKFLDTHSKFLYNGTVRAVCAVGISTGILLETQKRTQNGSVPFWNHVNRLELDLNRIQSLFPQVMNKFYQYNEHKYDGILSYLGTEIANLDPSERGLSNEFVSLVFAVGLSVGYLISRDKLESDI